MRAQGHNAAARTGSARGATRPATKTVGGRPSSSRGSALKKNAGTTSASKIQNETAQE